MEPVTIICLSVIGGLFLITFLIGIFGSFFVVKQQEAAIVQRFGKFKRIAQAGLNFKIPLIDSVAGRESLRVQQLNVKVETKTKDNVFVRVLVAVQFFVKPDKVYEAFYKLSDVGSQIEAFVFDVVRAQIPVQDLDDVFQNKEKIADTVKHELAEVMDDFGYEIVKALVTDIDPDDKVKNAMNEINAAQRLRVAANEKGEAEKILCIKKAEAESESKRLQGEGIAKERAAIIHGLKTSIEDMKGALDGCSSQDVLNLLLMTQYFDTLKAMGASDKATTILVPHSPGALNDLLGQLRNTLVSTGAVEKA